MKIYSVAAIIAFCLIGTLHPQKAKAQDVDCKHDETQMALNICSYREYQAADAELNRVYRQVLARNARFATSIRAAQRAWIVFRDKECAIPALQYQGGSIAPLEINTCNADLTRERTQHLRANYLQNN